MNQQSRGRLRRTSLLVATAIAAVTAVTVLSGCAKDPPPKPIDAAAASHMLVLGSGALCTTDRDCSVPGARGACVLGTCFGLLTTESPSVRVALLEQIASASPKVQKAVVERLLKALSAPMSGMTTRVGAIEGLGITLTAGQPCAEACLAIRAGSLEADEPVAVAARLALSRIADPAVLTLLLADAREGTEHLRCSALRALAPYLAEKVSRPLLQTLVGALADRAPGVRRAAAETLAPRRSSHAEIATALDRAAERHPADLRYIVERARLGEGADL